MANRSLTSLVYHFEQRNINLVKKPELYRRFVYSIRTQWTQVGSSDGDVKENCGPHVPDKTNQIDKRNDGTEFNNNTTEDSDLNEKKWRLELAWLTKALEPASQLYKWALSSGSGEPLKNSMSSRSLADILISLQRSKTGIQDWSLSDLTLGLYLIYLKQTSEEIADINGVQINSDAIVQCLIYHTELAKGAYRENVAGLARNSMLQERNIIKFVKQSNVMRPGYYIGIDVRHKLVILCIRGTHTVYDLITDMVTLSDREMTPEGFSTHFGTAEAARWFLKHEVTTIKKCLARHQGFRLRLVGHSLGGATAAVLAIMLRKKSEKDLGFSPGIVSAVGFGTPPCVSKQLAESCSDFVSTIIMQDDIIPRLSTASLTRLRNEIIQTDWMSVLGNEDWKRFVDLLTNAKQVVFSVQDVARKLVDFAKLRGNMGSSDHSSMKEHRTSTQSMDRSPETTCDMNKASRTVPEELFTPGSVYCLKRKVDSGSNEVRESFTLWKRQPREHFQRILLSSNFISDHKCDSHYYALRDVLKSLPCSDGNDFLGAAQLFQ